MLTVVITPEIPRPDEAGLIVRMLESGIDRVHLRHPKCDITVLRNIIKKIPLVFCNRISLHDCFDLVSEFPGLGVNLNSRNSQIPYLPHGLVSRSCHSVEETCLPADYVLLSPIFPCISKPGYSGSFSAADLRSLPSGKVVALGGVTPERIEDIKRYSFIGAAFSGYVWNNDMKPAEILSNVAKIVDLK